MSIQLNPAPHRALPRTNRRTRPRWRPSSRPSPMTVVEAAAAAGASGAAAATPSLASVLTRHVLRDGEAVLLILKPSRWYILFTSMRFIVATGLLLCLLFMNHARSMRNYVDLALLAATCRVMWSSLQWMGRLYLLTDQRVLRVSGVFHVEVQDCPLRKVQAIRLVHSLVERLFRLGSIDILPIETTRSLSTWQNVRKPLEVCQQIEAALRRIRSA